jgi:hypothetical protein
MYGQVVEVEEVISRIFAVTPDTVGELAQKLLARQELSLAAIGSSGILPAVEQEFNRWWR